MLFLAYFVFEYFKQFFSVIFSRIDVRQPDSQGPPVWGALRISGGWGGDDFYWVPRRRGNPPNPGNLSRIHGWRQTLGIGFGLGLARQELTNFRTKVRAEVRSLFFRVHFWQNFTEIWFCLTRSGTGFDFSLNSHSGAPIQS